MEETKPEIDLTNASNDVRWLVCVYYALVTMGTIGYGDIVPTTSAEIALVIIFIVGGIAYFGFLVSMVNAMMTSQRDDPGSAMDLGKFQEMEMWLKRFSLSPKLRSNIRRHTMTHILHGPTEKDTKFYENLPLRLKLQTAQELQSENLNALLGGADAIKALPPGTVEKVANAVAIASTPQGYVSGMRIEKAGVEDIVFLEEGEVALFFPGSIKPARITAPAVLGMSALLAQWGDLNSQEPVIASATSVFIWRVEAALLTKQLLKFSPEGLLTILEHYKEWMEKTTEVLEGHTESHDLPGMDVVRAAYKEKLDIASLAIYDVNSRIKAAAEEEERARLQGSYSRKSGGMDTSQSRGDIDDSMLTDLEENAEAVQWNTAEEGIKRQATIIPKEDGTLRGVLAATVLKREGSSMFIG